MHIFLDNPVFESLVAHDRHLGSGTDKVKYFDEGVSPFAGFETGYGNGFRDLHALIAPERNILFASRHKLNEQKGWNILHEIKGLQFVFDKHLPADSDTNGKDLVPLQYKDIPQMVELATLTKPGPFSNRTIEFGHYYGVFEKGKLVAMTGQRMHVKNYSEISAVCTHPDHLGKGYAYALMQHQLQLIKEQGQIPFLHVREDNERAIRIYERSGFKMNGKMNFYVMKRL